MSTIQDFTTTPQPENPSNVTVAAVSATASRRLPPPCWSHDETIALIDSYREKWYSLNRGNLRANHWQEVADDVVSRSPIHPPKTAVQCRHKMEKLRKRYRGEIQRAAPYGGARSNRYCSAWVHFTRMDAMERGPNADSNPPDDGESEDDGTGSNRNCVKLVGNMYDKNVNSSNWSNFQGNVSNGGGGFRIRIPAIPMAIPYSRVQDYGVENPTTQNSFGSSKVFRDGFVKKDVLGKRIAEEEVEEKKNGDPLAELAGAIKVLGDGFVRVERMKMDMARELEEMRMEMEMKRTEMLLESQQRIVEAFAQALLERKTKKAKRMPTPEC